MNHSKITFLVAFLRLVVPLDDLVELLHVRSRVLRGRVAEVVDGGLQLQEVVERLQVVRIHLWVRDPRRLRLCVVLAIDNTSVTLPTLKCII